MTRAKAKKGARTNDRPAATGEPGWWGQGRSAQKAATPDAAGAGVRRRFRPIRAVVAFVVHRSRVSYRFRRFTLSLGVLLAVVLSLGCAVGVIMLNNIVIQRSAELGELEHARRILRTENALAAADIARLSAPPRIARRARRDLGMTKSPEMARFIYLDPANRPMTPERRRRIERQAAVQAARQQATPTTAVASRAAAPSGTSPTSSTSPAPIVGTAAAVAPSADSSSQEKQP